MRGNYKNSLEKMSLEERGKLREMYKLVGKKFYIEIVHYTFERNYKKAVDWFYFPIKDLKNKSPKECWEQCPVKVENELNKESRKIIKNPNYWVLN